MPWHRPLSKKYLQSEPKYGNKRAELNDRSFHSGLERDVYAALLMLERAGEISNIRFQQTIHITPSIHHKIDFIIFDEKRQTDIGIEAKGYDSEGWVQQERAYKDFTQFPIQIWKKSGSRVFMFKEIPIGDYDIVKKG